jgi:hypothetical protein
MIVEVAAYFTVDSRTTDANRDHRFLHLRSLSLLTEPIIAALAERYGTDDDRRKMTRGSVVEPLKAFLSDRRDWRGTLWHAIQTEYGLTNTSGDMMSGNGTTSAAEQFIGRLKAIQNLRLRTDVDGAAKQILTLAAMRNFGAHRFSRDVALLHEYGGIMTGAALFTPMLYWKIATTLG